uniref:Uncharacterized protein n=1 Tax=Cyanothece sp. (strain PCC 7425 / ATCC 29141) TaxID=395961 RepID=B8HLT5_CYAP4
MAAGTSACPANHRIVNFLNHKNIHTIVLFQDFNKSFIHARAISPVAFILVLFKQIA